MKNAGKEWEVALDEQKNKNEEKMRKIKDLETELAVVMEKMKMKESKSEKVNKVDGSDGHDSELINFNDDKEDIPNEVKEDERSAVMDVGEEPVGNEDKGIEKLRDEEKVEGDGIISNDDDTNRENTNNKRERSPNDETVKKNNLKSKISKWMQWDGDGNFMSAKIKMAEEKNECSPLLETLPPAPPRPPRSSSRSRSNSLSRSQGRSLPSHPLETPPGSPASGTRRRVGSVSGVEGGTGGTEARNVAGSGSGSGSGSGVVRIKDDQSGEIVGFDKVSGEWYARENY